MKQEMMTIVRQQQLAPRIYEMVLTGKLVEQMKRPGQFIHIRVPRADLLLRRPISINQIDQEKQPVRLFIGLKGMAPKFLQSLKQAINWMLWVL